MRSEEAVSQAIDRYADMVWRLCVVHLKNHADAEDIFQTVFLKYALCKKSFESDAHEKAWLIRVTINAPAGICWAASLKPGRCRWTRHCKGSAA